MKTALLLLAPLMMSSAAFARTDAQKFTERVAAAKISLVEAAKAAATRANGTAVSAELDTHMGQTSYQVEVLSGNRLYEVNVNAQDGSIVDMREDVD